MNVLRGFGSSAQKARQTHCIRGHEFTAENTYLSKKGRNCRTCMRFLKEQWAARLPAVNAPSDATKVCKKCGQRKPLHSDFTRSRNSKDGYFGSCKACWNKRRAVLRLERLS
jgi:hypothetical protein